MRGEPGNKVSRALIASDQKGRDQKPKAKAWSSVFSAITMLVAIGTFFLTKKNNEATAALVASQIESARADGLIKQNAMIDALMPVIVVSEGGDVRWGDQEIMFPMMFKSGSSTSFRVKVMVTVTLNSKKEGVPQKGDWQVSVCEAGMLAPTETLNCPIFIRAQRGLDMVETFDYKYTLELSPYFNQASPLIAEMRKSIGDEKLRDSLTRTVTYQGSVAR